MTKHHDITIRVIVPRLNPATGYPFTEREIRAAVWRRAHGHPLDVVKIEAIDWRAGNRAYRYGDAADVWTNLRPILRTIGWDGFRIAPVTRP